uniref:Uncharacterized protein n=1 Tax=Anguilla anguilla TaxID=7936 RepID=A0A0E9PS06_ANGAN
MLPYALHVSN